MAGLKREASKDIRHATQNRYHTSWKEQETQRDLGKERLKQNVQIHVITPINTRIHTPRIGNSFKKTDRISRKVLLILPKIIGKTNTL